jgi:hypothetical protein
MTLFMHLMHIEGISIFLLTVYVLTNPSVDGMGKGVAGLILDFLAIFRTNESLMTVANYKPVVMDEQV